MAAIRSTGITVVPSAKDLVDVVLSRTQRRTPTVIHKGYAISRIRAFYMRKVKFTQATLHEKLRFIVDEFPRVDDIHPFHADLLNVLYDRDHYKLALAQVDTACKSIGNICKEYIKLLKYGDTLYRCKQLKRSALGRMCKVVLRNLGPSLAYLEQVRQHISRLPSIDPNTRTLLVCGFPNVGKSSFVNKTTRADVEVQPYAFTTKSLFVGHTDYKYLRWQVVDTPGILDHPLEDRNTIEMLSVTALAHLKAAVLFFVDVSGSCGYSIAKQAALFHSIKVLLAGKPLVVVCNKIDLQPLESLPEEDKGLIQEMRKEAAKCIAGLNVDDGKLCENDESCLVAMSALTDEGVAKVKQVACEKLLQQRVDVKTKSKKLLGCLNRFHVAIPKPRDGKERPPCIPHCVRDATAEDHPKKVLEKELEEQNGGAGVYSADFRKNYILEDNSWKNDVMPEIVDGKNVADFYDKDIQERLAELEREPADELMESEEEDSLSPQEREALAAVRAKKRKAIELHRVKKSVADKRPVVPRKLDRHREFTARRMEKELSQMGIDPDAAIARARAKSRSVSRTRGTKRGRSPGDGNDPMDVDEQQQRRGKRLRSRSLSRSRSLVTEVIPGEGFKDTAEKSKAVKLGRKAMKVRNKLAKRGEADRVVFNLKPKHLFSGKRSIGKTQRR